MGCPSYIDAQTNASTPAAWRDGPLGPAFPLVRNLGVWMDGLNRGTFLTRLRRLCQKAPASEVGSLTSGGRGSAIIVLKGGSG